MDSTSSRYERLARDRLGHSSLWLGEDHLVHVRGSGFLVPFSEEYRRFSLSEIEAFTLARTSRVGKGLLYLSVVLMSAALATLVLLLSESLRPVTVVFLSLFILAGLVGFALLLRHLVLGPTCVCDLQTPLSRERIRPLNRYHHTRQVVARIEGLVRETQAGLAASRAEGNTGEGVVRATVSRPANFFEIPRMAPPAFAVFILVGILGLAGLHLESVLVTGAILLLLVAASQLLTIALIAVVRKPTPEAIRLALWSLLGIHFVVIGAGAVYFLFAATRDPAYTVGLTGPLEAFTAIATDGGLVVYGLFVALFLGSAAGGLAGLVQTAKWRRQIRLGASLAGGAEKVEEASDES